MVSLDYSLALQIVNFLILMVVVNRLLLIPLRDLRRRREETLEGLRAEIQSSRDQVAKLALIRDRQLEQAREEMGVAREKSLAQARSTAKALVDQARAEAQRRVTAAEEDWLAQKPQLEEECRRVAPILGAAMAEVLLAGPQEAPPVAGQRK